MFRFVVLFAMLLAFPAWADYQLNLSVLDSLSMENDTEELPLPEIYGCPISAVPAKPVKKPSDSNSQNASSAKESAPDRIQIPAKSEVVETTETVTPAEKIEVVSEPVVKPAPENMVDPAPEKNLEQIVVADTKQDADTTAPASAPAEPEQIVPEFKAETTSEPIVNADTPIEPLVTVSTPADQPAEKNNEKTSSDAENEPAKEIELSVPSASLIPFDDNNSANSVQITFGDNSDVLSDEAISELDRFVEKNKDDPTGKILIEAYHYNSDNGFARKRTSLNRAVNIRSYLLNRGFKSFNIQIINTEEEVLQNNTVVSR